jgi:cytochrome c biogenesis protein ResB
VYKLVAGPGESDVKLAAFLKKGGVYLLHLGVVVMMAGEVITGVFSQEAMMVINQGETVNFVQKTTEVELAITDVTDPKRKVDDIFAIYEHALARGGTITHKDMPFEVSVVKFMKNAELRRLAPEAVALADVGRGKDIEVIEKPVVSGAGQEKEMDLAAIVFELKDKATGKSLGKRLASMALNPEKFEFEGKTYEVEIRNRREYRDFFVRLNKAEQKNHPNMPMARDYSSWVQIINAKTQEDREVRIYMNVPLRYNGETYYQANMTKNPDGTFTTGLQVVHNPGWPLPYWACAFVALGMLIHFGIQLVGFASRSIAS